MATGILGEEEENPLVPEIPEELTEQELANLVQQLAENPEEEIPNEVPSEAPIPVIPETENEETSSEEELLSEEEEIENLSDNESLSRFDDIHEPSSDQWQFRDGKWESMQNVVNGTDDEKYTLWRNLRNYLRDTTNTGLSPNLDKWISEKIRYYSQFFYLLI